MRGIVRSLAGIAGAIMVCVVGWALAEASLARGGEGLRAKPWFGWIIGPMADALGRLSYDLPFIVRGHVDIPKVCIVYIDEGAARDLKTRLDPWDRRLHAKLVRRLTDQGARAVLFDIVFSEPWPEAAVDEDFAAAMAENGNVFIGAAFEMDDGLSAAQERTVAPIPILRRAAAGWGLLTFRPVDPDYGVRRLFTGLETVPTATWRAAKKLGAPLGDDPRERLERRWVNYYGRAELFPSLSYSRALADDAPPGFFHDRIVIVGGRSTLGTLQLGKDDFRNPYGVIGAGFSRGPEVHLTVLLNLLRGEWLTRIPERAELAIALLVGGLLGVGLPWFRPHIAAVVAAAAFIAIAAFAVWLVARQHLWFAWAVPAFVQIPLALVWAVGARYFVEERRRNVLREAFAHYLSPQMADRIADADFNLSLGGTVVEATVMFTDLENFSALAEELEQPELVSEVLTTYFTQTTGHILESDGTIVKYMGDSVQAVWGAPLPDQDHARKAALAAWRLHLASQMEVKGHPLRTRIGLTTGRMLSGNLGSAQRFDYAVTGDEVNFASRLEGLNKYLGTSVLVSETVQAHLGDLFTTRRVGEFCVVGKRKGRVVYELLGPLDTTPPDTWMETFAGGLAAFRTGDLPAAEAAMRGTISQRGDDGPAKFYLTKIADLRRAGLPPDWSGIIVLDAK